VLIVFLIALFQVTRLFLNVALRGAVMGGSIG
jgi:hypothetical protein